MVKIYNTCMATLIEEKQVCVQATLLCGVEMNIENINSVLCSLIPKCWNVVSSQRELSVPNYQSIWSLVVSAIWWYQLALTWQNDDQIYSRKKNIKYIMPNEIKMWSTLKFCSATYTFPNTLSTFWPCIHMISAIEYISTI